MVRSYYYFYHFFPNPHPNPSDKTDWKINPETSTDILIVGDSNLRNLKPIPTRWEVHCLSGAKLQHVNKAIKNLLLRCSNRLAVVYDQPPRPTPGQLPTLRGTTDVTKQPDFGLNRVRWCPNIYQPEPTTAREHRRAEQTDV